jgi:nucleoside-diphosphate-sugar epimerase
MKITPKEGKNLMNILVTGANGFVGRALCDHLTHKGMNTYALLRRPQENLNVKQQFIVENLLEHADWGPILKGINVVIHTAGLAHVRGRPDKDYYDINTEITKKLALECVKAGVKRFVYVSSTHVHVSSASPDILTPESSFNPKTAYGKSKLLAEKALREIEKGSGLEIVIVRPPLVYGPNVSGNVLTLLKAIKKNMPFPFGNIQNRRSMIFIKNLTDALSVCATHSAAHGHTFFVSDDRPLSIGELIQGLATGMDKRANLFYFPEILMKIPFKLLGKSETLEKITGSLQLDISPIQKTLGWRPPVSVEEGLEATARFFQEDNKK